MKTKRCQAIHPDLKKRCELKEHRRPEPHRLFRRREPHQIVTWEDPPLDSKRIVGATIGEDGLVAFTRDRAGDFINAMSKPAVAMINRFRGKAVVRVFDIEDPDDAIESGKKGTVRASHGEPLDAEVMEKLGYLLVPCWSCGSLPALVRSDQGHRLICPGFERELTACRRSLRLRSRVRLEDAAFDWRMMQRDRK